MSHLSRPRNHEESRSAVCGLCFKKQGLRPITEKQVEQLRNLVVSSFSLSDSKYQKVLCKTCALALSAHTDHPEKPGRKLPKPHYGNLRPPPPDTRAKSSIYSLKFPNQSSTESALFIMLLSATSTCPKMLY